MNQRALTHRRILLAVIATVAMWAVHMLLRQDFRPGEPARLLVTGLLVLAFCWVILEEVRFLKNQDEFIRQTQCLALAIAFPAALILLFAFGFFRAEGVLLLQGGDPRDLPFILMITYAAGLTIAIKRYD